MATQSDFSVYIDKSVYKGEYADIKEELITVFIQIGIDLGWKLKDSNPETILFSTPISMRSFGETVTVNYSTHRIYITSVSNQKSVFTTWGKNDDNCTNYLNNVLEEVKIYLNNKESSRQSSNKKYLDVIRKDLIPLQINKDLFKIISDNQSKVEKTLIPNFIKVFKYYEEQVNTYNVIFNNINDLKFHTLHSWSIEYSIESIKIYSSTIQILEQTTKELFESYINEDLIKFYTLYNKFEDMGLFMSKGEKLMLRSLDDINENMENLISGIDSLVDNVLDLGKSLDDINSNIEFNNLLTSVNTYQLSRL